ncbi:MAG: phosphoribosylformylglycinamidine cyclo-ligase [Chlorobi bacterium]|nr:phosphoribosylformylglycinamidine cyclo-ligase [Chlorobiota bacterium]
MQKKSGVDINLGNKASKIAYNYAIDTFQNRKGKRGAVASKSKGGFSNLLIFGKERIGIGSDGIGTKAELAERTGIYDTLGYDLVAMVADDLAAMGFEPTNLSNVIDVDYLDAEIIDALMKGLKDACNFAGITITGGEIAELGNRIGGYGKKMHFNWSSTAIGILPENLKDAIDGSKIKEGQLIFSLKSRGFRSNGFSSIRRILKENFGEDWHNEAYDENITWGEKMLTPSLIYSPLINEIIASGSKLTGVVHITGGGIFDNLRRALKLNNVGANLNNLFEPLTEMLKIQQFGNVSNEDAYLWWNMGNGMLIIADEKYADNILQKAKQLNYECRIAGSITAGSSIQVEFPTFKMKKEY